MENTQPEGMKATNPFEYQKPAPNHIEHITTIREKCKELNELLETILPTSRYASLAKTKLEEVSMWANKAIVFTILPDDEK